ncbi:MAG: hypothetical protein LBG22_03975 [Treponema sp.]|jgi:hypothetical protein|nr:hypothetical protein [Treponema sp.]
MKKAEMLIVQESVPFHLSHPHTPMIGLDQSRRRSKTGAGPETLNGMSRETLLRLQTSLEGLPFETISRTPPGIAAAYIRHGSSDLKTGYLFQKPSSPKGHFKHSTL